MSRTALALALTLLCAGSAQATPSSYRAVRDRVFSDGNQPLPTMYLPEARAVLGVVNGVLIKRSGRTTTQETDFKDPHPKVVHGLGVCAEALWTIDGESGATGLLAPGTRVPAILRFSSGGNRVVWTPPIPRVLGIAVKLFPSPDIDAPVETRNLVIFDELGLNGSLRKSFVRTTSGAAPIFRNVSLGNLPHTWAAWALLRFFSAAPFVRPLEPFTSVTGHGAPVNTPVTPLLLDFIPRVAESHARWDFRDELLSYRPGELSFDIVIPPQPGFPSARRIGSLVVGRMTAGRTCDQSLHFFHHPWPSPERAREANRAASPLHFFWL